MAQTKSKKQEQLAIDEAINNILLLPLEDSLPVIGSVCDALENFIENELKKNPKLSRKAYLNAVKKYLHCEDNPYNLRQHLDGRTPKSKTTNSNQEEVTSNQEGEDSTTRNRNRLTRIKELCLGFDIDPQYFGLKNEHIFTRKSPKATLKEVVDLDFNHIDDDGIEALRSIYLAKKKPYVDAANFSIVAHEFLGKGTHYKIGAHLYGHQKAYVDIFKSVEERLLGTYCETEECPGGKECTSQTNIRCKEGLGEYTRILTIPFSKDIPNSQKLIEAIKECSLTTFEHICNCVINYSEKVKFYVGTTISPMHFVIIDDNIIMSEYYKYSFDLFLIPDLLIIEKCPSTSSPLDDLKKSYKKKIKQLIYHDELRITKDNIKSLTLDANDQIEKACEKEKNLEDWKKEMKGKLDYLNNNWPDLS